MRWLALYDRRIVNVNVNIVAAGLMAMVVTVGVMHLAERFGVLHAIAGWMPDLSIPWRGRRVDISGDKLTISGLTFLVDVVADVLVYYVLHWLANHMPRKTRPVRTGAYANLKFMRDATLVQFERAILSPILYAAVFATQNTLLHRGWSVEAATAIGLGTGIALTRCLHTLWMFRQERRAGRPSAADIVGPDPVQTEPAAGESGDRARHKASA